MDYLLAGLATFWFVQVLKFLAKRVFDVFLESWFKVTLVTGGAAVAVYLIEMRLTVVDALAVAAIAALIHRIERLIVFATAAASLVGLGGRR